MMKNICILMVIAIFLAGCQKPVLAPAEYVKYVEDEANGLKVRKTVNDVYYELQYRPLEYEILRGIRSQPVTSEIFTNQKNEKKGLDYFSLRIGSSDGTDLEQRAMDTDEQSYLAYGFQEDILLLDDGDSLQPAIYHFEATYGLTPFHSFIIAFPKSGNKKEKTVVIHDKLFSLQSISLTVKEDAINNIPKLIIE